MTWFIVVLFIEYWLIFRQLLCPHCHKIVECPVPKLSLRVTLSVAPSGGAASSHVTRPVEPATTVSVKVVTRGSATPWVHTVPHWIQYCSLYLSFNWEIQCQNKDIVISLDQLEIWPPQLYHWWPPPPTVSLMTRQLYHWCFVICYSFCMTVYRSFCQTPVILTRSVLFLPVLKVLALSVNLVSYLRHPCSYSSIQCNGSIALFQCYLRPYYGDAM